MPTERILLWVSQISKKTLNWVKREKVRGGFPNPSDPLKFSLPLIPRSPPPTIKFYKFTETKKHLIVSSFLIRYLDSHEFYMHNQALGHVW